MKRSVLKIKYFGLAFMMTFVIAHTMDGQTAHDTNEDANLKNSNALILIGVPVFVSTLDSLDTKVWILSQKKNKEIMKANIDVMKEKNIEMEKPARDAMSAGTHCFLLNITNILNGDEITSAAATVEVVSPAKKNYSFKLLPMMNYFGSGVSLNEKGEYQFTINLNYGSICKTTHFKYKVK